MGCRNACICSGRCSESCYEAEKYCGEAEDIYDELHGKSKEEEEYYKADEEKAEEYADWFWGASPSERRAIKQAYLAGLKAGKGRA